MAVKILGYERPRLCFADNGMILEFCEIRSNGNSGSSPTYDYGRQKVYQDNDEGWEKVKADMRAMNANKYEPDGNEMDMPTKSGY